MKKSGFTLIELLIVVAIIAILAAIAVPNFLEAQVRAKNSRAKADMRTVALGVSSYRVDYATDPAPIWISAGDYDRIWLGFVSWRVTTPIAYLTSLPNDVYPESFMTPAWIQLNPQRNTEQNQPYVHLVRVHRTDNGNEVWHYSADSLQAIIDAGRASGMDSLTAQTLANAPSVFHSAGPDGELTMTARGNNGATFAVYDPTNGTVSAGDLLRPEN